MKTRPQSAENPTKASTPSAPEAKSHTDPEADRKNRDAERDDHDDVGGHQAEEKGRSA